MRNRSERHEELLQAAAQVFHEKGYTQTSLQDIADRMKFTKPAIYYYAESKEALFTELYEAIVVSGIENARAVATEEGSGRLRFEKLIKGHMRIFIENVQANAILEVARGALSAETRARMTFLEREYSTILRDVYQAGINDRSLTNLDPGLVVNTVIGACNSLHRWYMPKGKFEPDEFIGAVLRLLGDGFNSRQ